MHKNECIGNISLHSAQPARQCYENYDVCIIGLGQPTVTIFIAHYYY